jgi:hypothetical protein
MLQSAEITSWVFRTKRQRTISIFTRTEHEVTTDDLRDALQFCVRSLFEILSFAVGWRNVHDAKLFAEIDRLKFA